MLPFLLFLAVNLIPVLGKTQRPDDFNCVFHSLPVPLYHVHDLQNDNDILTASISEMEQLLQAPNFEGDGVIGSVFLEDEAGMVPFYRLYNQVLVDHFYTFDASQRDSAEQSGYDMLEIVGYVLPALMCDSMPLYRFQNEQTGRHHYALSQDFQLAIDSGYAYQDVAGYILPPYTPGSA